MFATSRRIFHVSSTAPIARVLAPFILTITELDPVVANFSVTITEKFLYVPGIGANPDTSPSFGAPVLIGPLRGKNLTVKPLGIVESILEKIGREADRRYQRRWLGAIQYCCSLPVQLGRHQNI